MLDYSFDGTFSLSPIEIGCGIRNHSMKQLISHLSGTVEKYV